MLNSDSNNMMEGTSDMDGEKTMLWLLHELD